MGSKEDLINAYEEFLEAIEDILEDDAFPVEDRTHAGVYLYRIKENYEELFRLLEIDL